MLRLAFIFCVAISVLSCSGGGSSSTDETPRSASIAYLTGVFYYEHKLRIFDGIGSPVTVEKVGAGVQGMARIASGLVAWTQEKVFLVDVDNPENVKEIGDLTLGGTNRESFPLDRQVLMPDGAGIAAAVFVVAGAEDPEWSLSFYRFDSDGMTRLSGPYQVDHPARLSDYQLLPNGGGAVVKLDGQLYFIDFMQESPPLVQLNDPSQTGVSSDSPFFMLHDDGAYYVATVHDSQGNFAAREVWRVPFHAPEQRARVATSATAKSSSISLASAVGDDVLIIASFDDAEREDLYLASLAMPDAPVRMNQPFPDGFHVSWTRMSGGEEVLYGLSPDRVPDCTNPDGAEESYRGECLDPPPDGTGAYRVPLSSPGESSEVFAGRAEVLPLNDGEVWLLIDTHYIKSDGCCDYLASKHYYVVNPASGEVTPLPIADPEYNSSALLGVDEGARDLYYVVVSGGHQIRRISYVSPEEGYEVVVTETDHVENLVLL